MGPMATLISRSDNSTLKDGAHDGPISIQDMLSTALSRDLERLDSHGTAEAQAGQGEQPAAEFEVEIGGMNDDHQPRQHQRQHQHQHQHPQCRHQDGQVQQQQLSTILHMSMGFCSRSVPMEAYIPAAARASFLHGAAHQQQEDEDAEGPRDRAGVRVAGGRALEQGADAGVDTDLGLGLGLGAWEMLPQSLTGWAVTVLEMLTRQFPRRARLWKTTRAECAAMFSQDLPVMAQANVLHGYDQDQEMMRVQIEGLQKKLDAERRKNKKLEARVVDLRAAVEALMVGSQLDAATHTYMAGLDADEEKL